MKNIGKKLLMGGTVLAAAAAVGAYCYKRYMDDFYEYIVDEEFDECEEGIETDAPSEEAAVTEEDFEPVAEEVPAE